VIIPRVYDTLLRTKYNSDFSLNGAAYTEAQDIIKKIQEGAKFEDVALNSDDKITGQLGGDLGFVTPKQVIPELGNLLADLKSGEVAGTAVASRYGYHVLYLSEVAEKDGQKQYHLKHILVTTLGYEQWLDQQLKKIPVRRIK
jgi:peptidyl-prolyl cis-trans isomerase C